ncbi:TetR family transcriptional regulator [Nonomuraea sp. JJY05]|uniref:TetR family transcriptional regulator n=1 Tax=Nonomuraea sp. JJY05 TaxID=3350255 RepID=UPI00373F944B
MTESKRRGPRRAEAERNDRALLQAARQVLAADGEHASVAAIAAAAGVGIGSLYRRYGQGRRHRHRARGLLRGACPGRARRTCPRPPGGLPARDPDFRTSRSRHR